MGSPFVRPDAARQAVNHSYRVDCVERRFDWFACCSCMSTIRLNLTREPRSSKCLVFIRNEEHSGRVKVKGQGACGHGVWPSRGGEGEVRGFWVRWVVAGRGEEGKRVVNYRMGFAWWGEVR